MDLEKTFSVNSQFIYLREIVPEISAKTIYNDFLLKKMFLTEEARRDVLKTIGNGGRICTKQVVCNLFNATYPDRLQINQSTLSKIEREYRKFVHVRN